MKRKHIIGIILLLCVIVPFCLLPIGAVSIDGYYNDGSGKEPKYGLGTVFDDESILNNYYTTNTPCSIAWIDDLSYGSTENLVYNMQGQIQLSGWKMNDGTLTTGYTSSNDYKLSNQTVVDGDGNNTKNVFDDFPFVGFTQTRLFTEPQQLLDRDGEVVKELPYVTVHQTRCVGVRDVLSDGSVPKSVYPYGLMLRGGGFTLIPQNYEEYMSPVIWGYSSALGYTVGATSGIGGCFLAGVTEDMYENAHIRYVIDYTTAEGVKGTYNGTAGLISNSNYYNATYDTLRVPLIPIGFISNFVSGYEVLYIDNVNVTLWSDVRYQNPDTETIFIFTVDSCTLTTTDNKWKEDGEYNFDVELLPYVKANFYQQFVEPNYTFEEWRMLTAWLGSAVGGFMEFEIAYGISIGGIFVVCLGFGCVLMFLKFFAGG